MTKVINIKYCKVYDIYCGRPGPWGNKYSSKPSNVPGTIIVPSRDIAIRNFTIDLYTDLDMLELAQKDLKDKTLACWCKLPGIFNKLQCHVQVLAFAADHPDFVGTIDEILEGAKSY